MEFIGRKREIAFLEDCYTSSDAQLVVLYGRRRVGKTELLRKFCEGKQHLFTSAKEAPAQAQLESFSQQMFAAGAPAGRYIDAYQSWEAALMDVADLPFAGKKLLIIDEFPYLVKADSSLPSVLQNLWDSTLKDANVMIVLCGSAMSFIEKEILSEKNPLYGRATGILKLEPLSFWEAGEFFPKYSLEDKVIAFCILGGIPHYLLQFDPGLSIEDNVKRYILRRGCALYSEVEFLMRQEFRETATYNSIVQAVALGATQLNEIAQKSMIPAQKASVYIKNLIETGILKREFCAGAGMQERSKGHRGLYRVCDSFFRFWYSYVFTNLSMLEMSDVDGVWEHDIAPTLNDFCAVPFEDMCRAWMLRANVDGELPFRAVEVGRWWSSDKEIDVLALDKGDKHALIGECKFRNKQTGIAVYEGLNAKASKFTPQIDACYLFSKAGFDKALSNRAAGSDDPKIELVGLEELYSA